MVEKAGRKARMFSGVGALAGQIDRYNGITIANDAIKDDLLTPDNFRSTLANSLQIYQKEGFRGVWLKLQASQIHLAGIAAQE
jgi:hypothetical protein